MNRVFQVYRYHLWHFIAFISFLSINTSYAASPLWSWEKELSLEKEQTYQALIQVGDVQKELIFRWTLYKNYGLVIHLRYDKFNHQFVLYADYQRNAYKISLGKDTQAHKENPHLLIYFKDFIVKDEKAYFKLYIEGQGASVVNESISPSKKKSKDEDSVTDSNEGGS